MKGRGPSYGLNAEQKFALWASGAPDANGCILWTGPKTTRRKGKPGPIYGKMTVAGKVHKAHRYAWERANGPLPPGMGALHECDNALCVNEAHLFPGNSDANNKDRAAKGRNADTHGELNPYSKLTAAQVGVIRGTPRTYGSGKELAERFRVTVATVYSIRTGRRWNHGSSASA